MQALVARYDKQEVRLPLPTAEVTVGSSTATDITLPFPGVSRVHARLTPSRDGLLLIDEGSKNGVVCGGERVAHVILTAGCLVQLGKATLSVEDARTSEVAPAFPLSVGARTSRHDRMTGSAGATRSGNSAAALALVRDLERLSVARLRRSADEVLQRAMQLLSGDWIAMFEQPAIGELVIVRAIGRDTGGEVLDLLSAGAASVRSQKQFVSRAGARSLVVTAARKHGVVKGLALLMGRTPRAWELDLSEYLASKMGGIEPAASNLSSGPVVIPEGMVLGASPASKCILDAIGATVQSRLDVLLLGETGTGKELFARLIHQSGPTAAGPFVAVNCSAIPVDLLEAELFGIEARAATGVDARQGLFARSDGGTLFLDEIGDLPLPLQPKLLRVLQEREVRAVGASSLRKLDLRVVAASNRDLHAEVEQKQFRADLYYRLSGLQFAIPPLRERSEDIPTLALAFTARAADETRKRIRGVTRSGMDALLAYSWPGNIRELRTIMTRAVLLAPDGAALDAGHVTHALMPLGRQPESAWPATCREEAPTGVSGLQQRVEEAERGAILEALRAGRGNKSFAARMLGITRKGLALKMRRLGI